MHLCYIVTSKGKIISKSTNFTKKNKHLSYGHAERIAQARIRKIHNKYIKRHGGLILIVLRVMKDRTLGNSHPCPKCMVSFDKRIKKVIYSTGDTEKPYNFIKF